MAETWWLVVLLLIITETLVIILLITCSTMIVRRVLIWLLTSDLLISIKRVSFIVIVISLMHILILIIISIIFLSHAILTSLTRSLYLLHIFLHLLWFLAFLKLSLFPNYLCILIASKLIWTIMLKWTAIILGWQTSPLIAVCMIWRFRSRKRELCASLFQVLNSTFENHKLFFLLINAAL